MEDELSGIRQEQALEGWTCEGAVLLWFCGKPREFLCRTAA